MRFPHWIFHRRRRVTAPGQHGKIRGYLYHRSSLRQLKILRVLAILFFTGVVATIAIFMVASIIVSGSLPNPQKVVRHEGFSTKVLDRNGNLLYDVYENERIVPVTINEVPDYLKQATVATEDKDFYKHGGFDPLSPFRILYNVFRYHQLTGGSTLTQQLVKMVLLDNSRTAVRKFKELLLSMQIENAFTKDQILQMYLNEAPYGGANRGAGAASEAYFGKKPKDLTLVECAILAGLPQRPTAYSPLTGQVDENGKGLWYGRTQGVLRRMREDGYITSDQEKEALAQLEQVTFNKQALQVKAPHFVFYVKDQLEQMYGPQVLETGGLTVTTTLDYNLQQQAQQIVAEEIAKVENLHITNGAALVMDPKTGQILSMVGSKDFFATDYDGQFNVAVNGLRQPGSSIKPVTYLLALRRGFTPASVIMDTPTVFPVVGSKDYEPKNYDGKFRGPVQLRFALGSSLNIPAVKLLAIVGVKDMLSLAYDMGFPTLEPTAENMQRLGLSVTLGGGEVHLIDTVSSYSSFANGGTKVSPVSILKVQDQTGKVIYQYEPTTGKRVMSAQEAFLIDHILSDNNARQMTFGANSDLNVKGKPIAVKTGTTNNQVDNWTIGWSRNAMVGVWVGNNDNTAMKKVASGLTGASPIWRKIMDTAITDGYKDEAWEIPSGVSAVTVDSVSGYPEHDGFPSRAEYVIDGTLPSLPDPIHTNLKICRGQEKLASESDIVQNQFDTKEFFVLKENDPLSLDGQNRWQSGIDSWIGSQGDSRYHPPSDYCDSASNVFVGIDKPSDHANIDGHDVDVAVTVATDGDVNKVEVFANDALKTTLTSRPFSTTLHFDNSGKYKIYAKAYRSDGKSGTSGDTHIGVGGTKWDQADATPTPSPSPTPTPTANPSPTST